ncbi:LapA family protein [Novosphingobium resinovorum]|uniref:LapA family protein n=1 Tax=Novosphingobium resinovorum TaxID=158500 RepID=UPI002ED008B1|nr:LapA family protein [Novosphingobium resinovorum]
MKVIRTIAWTIVALLLLAFGFLNWGPAARVNFFPSTEGPPYGLDWPVAVIAIAFFLAGLLPMWLYLRAVRWRLNRRIASLENSLRATSVAALPQTAEAPEAASFIPPETPSEIAKS